MHIVHDILQGEWSILLYDMRSWNLYLDHVILNSSKCFFLWHHLFIRGISFTFSIFTFLILFSISTCSLLRLTISLSLFAAFRLDLTLKSWFFFISFLRIRVLSNSCCCCFCLYLEFFIIFWFFTVIIAKNISFIWEITVFSVLQNSKVNFNLQ